MKRVVRTQGKEGGVALCEDGTLDSEQGGSWVLVRQRMQVGVKDGEMEGREQEESSSSMSRDRHKPKPQRQKQPSTYEKHPSQCG